MATIRDSKAANRDARERWIAPALKKVGSVGDVLKQGGGKLSIVGGDPGEGRKQTGGD